MGIELQEEPSLGIAQIMKNALNLIPVYNFLVFGVLYLHLETLITYQVCTKHGQFVRRV